MWHTHPSRREARNRIDQILQTHGVEHLGVLKRSGEHVYYCNSGDAYATTVVFVGMDLRVQCWGTSWTL